MLLRDKIYLIVLMFAALVSLTAFYLFYQYIVKSGGVWLTPTFIPIYIYAVVIFVLNFILSVACYKRDKFLSYAANGATIAINIILLTAMLLNVINPNG